MRIPGALSSLVLFLLITAVTVDAAWGQQVPQRRSFPALSTGASGAPARAPAIRVESTAPAAIPSVIDVPVSKAQVIHFSSAIGNIVIGNETVADIHLDAANPRQVFVVSKAIGSTNVFFMNEAGAIVHQAQVNVTADYDGLKAALAKLLPDENIEVSVIRDSVFLAGNVRSTAVAAQAEDIARRFVSEDTSVTNMMKVVGSQQVILQVRVVEMDRAIRKNLSANTTVLVPNKLLTGDLTLTTSSPSPTLTAFGTGRLVHGIPGLGVTDFSALERQGLTKTLAEPTLTAISGQSASFLSGGEVPVPIGVDENGNAIIEFREFGIRLEFTPVVIDKGRINLQLAAEVSAIDTSISVTVANLNVNGFATKRANTTIDLPSGGSLMLAGLLQDDLTESINGMPFLKDIPVLGALFRSNEFQRDETELVITVTAYLAKPTDASAALALPTDGFEPASDIDIYLLGRMHRKYGKGERPFWKDPIKGPFGYIMR